MLFLLATPAAAASKVTAWTELADAYGNGLANWRTQAIMHQAIHDALNAISPRFERWSAPADAEPAASGALPGAAIASAAAQVLLLLHPSRQDETERALRRVLESLEEGAGVDAGIKLGKAIGQAAVERRDSDGSLDIRAFAGSTETGRWARTPMQYGTSNTSSTVPFLSRTSEAEAAPPPPPLDSDAYRDGLAEVRDIGAVDSERRPDTQTKAAFFWASQSSQRGYLNLAVRLLDQFPPAGGLHDDARIMSQMASAMADSAILTWREKEHFSSWRPVTAIRAGSAGVTPDPQWLPVLETPPFPEYPSGHAADCFTGSAFLQEAFGTRLGPVTYVSQERREAALEELHVGSGQHAQISGMDDWVERRFDSLAAAAQECAESRIWAGAHFRPAIREALRLGRLIAARAGAAVPRISRVGKRDANADTKAETKADIRVDVVVATML